MMEFTVRQETEADYFEVGEVVREAFRAVPEANGDEQDLVRRLRESDAFIPELSLVADTHGLVIGHIMLTKAVIENGDVSNLSLILAPLSVLPEYQKQGIGSALVEKAHETAAGLGYQSILVVGHEDYYPRFGYIRTDEHRIHFQFDVPAENAMIVELVPGKLPRTGGTAIIAPEFFP